MHATCYNGPMNFFKTIPAAIYSPGFYKTIPKKRFRGVLGYFLLLVFLAAMVQTIISAGPIASSFKEGVQKFAYSMVDTYPPELIITIEDGEVSTNVEEPYFLPLPELSGTDEYWRQTQGESGTFENLLVIDTKTSYSSVQMNGYDTVAWLTRDSLFMREGQGEINVVDLSDIQEFTLDREMIDSFVAKAAPYLKYLGPIVIAGVFLIAYTSYSVRLVYALFFAVVLLILSRMLKLHWSYGQAYKVSLYAMTAGIIVSVTLDITSPFHQFSGFPFMLSLITLGVVFANVRQRSQS